MRNPARVALACLALLAGAAGSRSWAQEAEPEQAEPAAPGTAEELARWVLASGDNQGLPFVIVDKPAAEVSLFDPDGELKAKGAALLGYARGDESTPGVGDRELSDIAPDERTTPAGRFMAGFGPAWGGETVFWVDYATAISLHPVITGTPKERRRQRLASPTPADNRITFGCINVAPAFFRVVRETFKDTRGVVYVLPDSKPLAEVFPTFALQQAQIGGAVDVAARAAGSEAAR